jgi:hypothetical protein
MRGFLQPATKSSPSETQTKFQSMARARRSKIAKGAQTTLLKADQWARGGAVAAEIAGALEKGTHSVVKK